MKYRRLMTACVLGLSMIALVGCTPVSDGWTEGVADGLSAATSAFIEEVANTLFGGVLPVDGA